MSEETHSEAYAEPAAVGPYGVRRCGRAGCRVPAPRVRRAYRLTALLDPMGPALTAVADRLGIPVDRAALPHRPTG
jgi:hypothetical protein